MPNNKRFNNIKNLSNKELLDDYKAYDQLIHSSIACYSVKDAMYFYELEREITLREEGI